jgi:hypothetical protein
MPQVCPHECQGKDRCNCTQSNEGNRSKFCLRSSITCISHIARQSARPGDFRGNHPALHDSQRRNNTKTCYRPSFRVYATNKKGDDASTDSQKHNCYDEGHSLPHDELASKNGLIIHTPIGI